METAESDNKGSALAAGFQVMHHSEPMSQEVFRPQDGNVQEGFRPLQSDKFTNMGTNRQFSAQSSISNTETSAREFLSSISSSPVVLSGLYCTGLYCAEGLAKDFSTLAAPNNSGVSKAYVGEMKFSGLNSTTCHIQRPWISQKPQNHQPKNLEKELSSQSSARVARPPGEGRGKNQLLPRYWPRITDQELQLLTTKDSNCTITPLFEKVLSASDAGKIGRLVLPKACAEAYFPPISQAEGLPITVQDISGKDWQFQFRFWPNNNSRMYVLEGITPCIQSMQLQAGDTVIFSRRDPEGKLVMGYRRASNMSMGEETRMVNAGPASVPPSTQILSRKPDKPSTANMSGLNPQLFKTSGRAQVQTQKSSGLSQALDLGFGLSKAGVSGSKETREGSPYNLPVLSEKRKAKDMSCKTKKPRCDADSLEFKMHWEEAQSLLRSPPNVIPSIVTIEGYDFEEYEDPPVFGNEIISSDSLPRKLCNMQQDVPSSIPCPSQHNSGIISNDSTAKKQTLVEPLKEPEAFSGLETLAFLATAEENVHVTSASLSPASISAVASSSAVPSAATAEVAATTSVTPNISAPASSPATTTKHPRHRPGCSCIVCIQPPSGKGPKHKPNCDCNVCMTVKRRFHTLMLRRKKLQSEKEAEGSSQKNQHVVKEGMESMGAGRRPNDSSSYKNGLWQGGIVAPLSKAGTPRTADIQSNRGAKAVNIASTGSYVVKMEPDIQIASKGPQIDLNIQPEKEEEMGRGGFRGLSMKSLLQNASYPLDIYLKQHGLASLVYNEQLPHFLENSDGTSFDKNDDDLEEKRPVIGVVPDGHEHDRTLINCHIKQ
ncbi:hypothetical protein GOP47_0016735 [Adiantum capillus-veneris]|uniref:TF-B3 domain-containing protein n=1 Tax=Adiantum capillus-veneris TaxID=13818 RepID=A0A9D4UIA1_ADICA|nr:hypothetical protein GOP47_0016735 [Adiantum capillus-veneris]